MPNLCVRMPALERRGTELIQETSLGLIRLFAQYQSLLEIWDTKHMEKWNTSLWFRTSFQVMLRYPSVPCLCPQRPAAPATSAPPPCPATPCRWPGPLSAVLNSTKRELPAGAAWSSATAPPQPAPCPPCAATPATTSPFMPSARPGAATCRVRLSLWQQVLWSFSFFFSRRNN